MIDINGLDAALAIVDLASEDMKTTDAGARALLEVVKPRRVDGELRWDITSLVAGVKLPFHILAGRLAEAWGCTHAEVLAALREDLEAQAAPQDLGDLEAVWGNDSSM